MLYTAYSNSPMKGKARIYVNMRFEKSYPMLIAFFFGAMSVWLGAEFNSSKQADQLALGINMSAILMGFLCTSKAMLLSFNSQKYTEIRAHKTYWALLISYFHSAMMANIALCLYSITIFWVDLELLQAWPSSETSIAAFLQPIWIFLTVLSFLSFYRVMRIIFSLLQA